MKMLFLQPLKYSLLGDAALITQKRDQKQPVEKHFHTSFDINFLKTQRKIINGLGILNQVVVPTIDFGRQSAMKVFCNSTPHRVFQPLVERGSVVYPKSSGQFT